MINPIKETLIPIMSNSLLKKSIHIENIVYKTFADKHIPPFERKTNK